MEGLTKGRPTLKYASLASAAFEKICEGCWQREKGGYNNRPLQRAGRLFKKTNDQAICVGAYVDLGSVQRIASCDANDLGWATSRTLWTEEFDPGGKRASACMLALQDEPTSD